MKLCDMRVRDYNKHPEKSCDHSVMSETSPKPSARQGGKTL